MSTVLLILLLIFIALLFYVRWQWIHHPQAVINFFLRRMMGQAERRRRQSERSRQKAGNYERRAYSRRSYDESIIPREYAEDVEFEDVPDSDEMAAGKETTPRDYETESQVSDAEWEEIK